jgi:hypothetical protein
LSSLKAQATFSLWAACLLPRIRASHSATSITSGKLKSRLS